MLYVAGPRLLPIVLFLTLPLILSPYWQRVMISLAVFAMLAISWDLLAQSGMISLGQALFFGMGAYLSGIFNHLWGFHPFLSIPLATLLGGLVCTLILLPVLRLRGIYFSMFTLILPLMLVRTIEATKIFGGTEGLSGMSPLPSGWVELYFIIIATLLVLFGFRRLMASDYGLVLQGIRDNDRSVTNAAICHRLLASLGPPNPRTLFLLPVHIDPSFNLLIFSLKVMENTFGNGNDKNN